MKKIIAKFNVINIMIIALLIIGSIGIFFLYNTNSIKTKEKIFFVSKSTDENRRFWGALEDGVKVASNSNDFELSVIGPKKEINISKQIELMEDLIREKPYGIIIAATDYEILSDVCDRAMESGIKLVAVDSDVRTKNPHTLVATDNKKAASLLASEIANISDGGNYAIISHVKGVKTTTDRAVGFKEEMDKHDSFNFIGEYYSNNSLEGSIEQTEKILDNSEVSFIYGTNEITLEGIGKVIEERGLQDEIMVLGFDSNEQIVYYLESGSVDEVMIQKPFNMGYLAVEELIKNKNNTEFKFIDTGAVMVDKNTVFDRVNSKLVFPVKDLK